MPEARASSSEASAAPAPPRFDAEGLTLPSPPLGLALVLEAAENEDTSLQRLGWIINREPSLTSHLLKLSNSAAYSVGRPVASVSQATVYLGARTIRNMTLSHIVRTVSLGVDVGSFDTTLFWEHSLRRAGAAHFLATRIGFDDPGEAFTAGLIQDLGLLIMAVQWPHIASQIHETARAMKEMSTALEIRIRPQPTYEELIRAAHRAIAKVSSRYEDETRRLEAMLAQQEAMRRNLESQNEELARLATTDPLTGVANRRALCDGLDIALRAARERGEPVTLLMLDLDHFKRVNDLHGHDAGDAVLRETASRIRGALRAGDLLGRLGGEEFGVVLANCPPEHGPYVAERLRIVLSLRPIRLPGGATSRVTASIGGASVDPGTAVSLEDVLKRSDLALYACKHSGRNCVRWFTPELDES